MCRRDNLKYVIFVLEFILSFEYIKFMLLSSNEINIKYNPVQYYITFRICNITYQTLSSKQPSYLHSLLPSVLIYVLSVE